jgi:hypothetical protein
LIIVLLGTHSLIDYPLRTEAVLAFASALLVEPLAGPEREVKAPL